MKCQVIERYQDFSLPFDAARLVRDLLRCVPKKDLAGLQSIVLTNEAAQSREDRRRHTHARHKKYRLADCRGFYQHARREEEAYIQLHMDQIFKRKEGPAKNTPTFRWRLAGRLINPFLRRARIAMVLFHEIGHHVQETKQRERGEPETLADRYMWKRFKALLWRRWYLACSGLAGLALIPLEIIGFIRSYRSDKSKRSST